MKQAHPISRWRELPDARAVAALRGAQWVETAPGSHIYDLKDVGFASAAFVKNIANSGAGIRVIDLTPGVSTGDASIIVAGNIATVR